MRLSTLLARLVVALVVSLCFTAGDAWAQDLVPNQIIVRLQPGANIEDVNATFGTTTIDVFEDDDGFDVLYLLDSTGLGDEALLAAQMMADPRVDEAEPNFLQDTPEGVRHMVVVAIGGTQADYEDQSLTRRIRLDAAHQITRGLGVTVAVLDTGIDFGHPLFAGRIAPGGYDFVEDDDFAEDTSDGLDNDGDGYFDDGFGHGTMVSSIVTLVAPDAYLLPIRVLDDEGRGDVFGIIRGVRLARERAVDVINMSFGMPGSISILQTEMERARAEGIVMVSGAGNENLEQEYFPGGSSQVFMVTALDSLDRKADFADYDDDVLVSAPGAGVRGAFPGGGWALGSGCSFATPFVTGEVALIRAIAPYLNVDQIESRVEAGVDPIYSIPGNEPYADGQLLGSGRIDLVDALAGLQTAGVEDPQGGEVPSPVGVYPNPARSSVSFSVGDLVVSSLTILDVTGRRLRHIDYEAGTASGSVVWDGTTTGGSPARNGLYLYQIRTEGQTVSGRLVLRR